MKKLFITLVAVVTICFSATAQKAIGIRGAFGEGYGAEVSYLNGFGSNSRMEFDLGINSGKHWNYINLTGVYQWVWNIDGGLGWFAGAGANVGLYTNSDEDGNNGLGLGIDGQIGLEYNFDFPMQLSLDWRPCWNFIGNSGFGYGVALGIRYSF